MNPNSVETGVRDRLTDHKGSWGQFKNVPCVVHGGSYVSVYFYVLIKYTENGLV